MGGLNCQCILAWPGATAQMPTCATRKKPPQPSVQLFSAPEAKANQPGGLVTLRNTQGPGPLHTSFCRTASKTSISAVTVLVTTQPVPMDDTRAFCIRPYVKVM